MDLSVETIAACGALDELGELIGACSRCKLSSTRLNVVPGAGLPSAKVMFIGEAPGRSEDEGGQPFSGASGALLDTLLEQAGLNRSDVFITSVLKCRPPGNRNPKQAEMDACAPILQRQIDLIDPHVIALMGSFAVKRVLGLVRPMGEVRGTVHEVARRTVIPVYHPAAALYDRSKLEVLAADFALIGSVAKGVGES